MRDLQPKPPIEVLFMHGLESRPDGTKTRIMQAQGFGVHAPDMHMSVLQLQRRNSVARCMLRLFELQAALTALGLGLLGAVALARVELGIAAAALALVWALARQRALVAKAVAASFAACVEVQVEALRRSPPDLVVGSSWGGAVALQVILQGEWRGPTILLAPAFTRVWAWAGDTQIEAKLDTLTERLTGPTVVFHDPADDVVPHADSVVMVEHIGERMELRTVDAGGHRLLGLLERGELADTIVELIALADQPAR